MLKIGDFSKLTQVPVKTLRYYDELGLITPVQVDAFTGYRYYSIEQLPRLNRLLALKDLGFSLEQIGQILNEGVSPEQLRGMLRLRRVEQRERVQEEQERLRRVETRLREIEQENLMTNSDVVLKTVPAQLVAARRVNIPTNDQVPTLLGPAFDEVWRFVDGSEAKFAGCSLAVWHSSPEAFTDEVAEAAFPIDRPIPETDHVKVYELPGVQVAAIVHHGPFDEFTSVYPTLIKWVEINGYRISGPYRELYLKHDRKNLADSLTEVQLPVEPA